MISFAIGGHISCFLLLTLLLLILLSCIYISCFSTIQMNGLYGTNEWFITCKAMVCMLQMSEM